MRKTTVLWILAILMFSLALCAQADGLGISSQFGFSGWPYLGTCVPPAATCPAETPPIQDAIPTCPAETVTAAPPSPTQPIPAQGFATPVPTFVPGPTPIPTSVPTLRPTIAPSAAPVRTAAPTGTPTPTRVPSPGVDYTTVSISAQEQNAYNLLNSDRIANDLAPLPLDPELCRLARIKCEDMRDRHYFAHESPTYGKAAAMLTSFGYPFSAVGENIAHHATVEKAQVAFMSSEGHRRNIVAKSWTKVGIGVCYDANGYVYVTQLFVR